VGEERHDIDPQELCHLALVRAAGSGDEDYRRLLLSWDRHYGLHCATTEVLSKSKVSRNVDFLRCFLLFGGQPRRQVQTLCKQSKFAAQVLLQPLRLLVEHRNKSS
jgi:hypothetical protein